jgi:signal transduction histidine kinase
MTLLQTGTNPASMPLSFLGYSLLIILISATSLVKVFRTWQKGKFTQGTRMIQVLLGMVLLRLFLFVITYLSWQNNPQFTPTLLILDQAASLLGIILLFWLWNFPEPSKEIDPAALGSIILIILLVFGQMFFFPAWANGFTGSMSFWQGLSITALVIGLGLILIRKPNWWHYGFFMGVILFLGSILSLLSGTLETMHLTQLVAYPLMLLLADRFKIGEAKQKQPRDDEELQRKQVSVEYGILELIKRLFDEQDPVGILYKIAQATAYLILADLALVIDTPDEHGKIRIIAGYDLIREEPLQALTLDSKSIPLLSNYIQRGKMLHIPASSTSRDLSHLSKILQLSRPGHLLAAPVYVAGANKTIGIVLFSPFSNRPWTKADQEYISLLCKLFESAFSHHLVSQNGESDSVKNTIRDLSSKLTLLSQEKSDLKADQALLNKEHQNLLMDFDNLSAKYTHVLGWGNTLQRHLAMLVDLSEKDSTQALKKYIGVIAKDVQQLKNQEIQSPVSLTPVPPDVDDAESEDVDPDSIRPAVLNTAIQSCLEVAESDIKEKNLSTLLDIPDNPPLLKMSHALFKEIFSFLVANAIDENAEGGEIQIRTQIYKEDTSQHFAHIKISDQGQGYHPDDIADVLNDHLTTEQQEKLSQVMTNLYVTKNLVENEGGRMWVESKPGSGTTVSLLLPFL